uniref:E2 ubiquitin-conjugating enzyme n=1 Tax=Culicoides sonorensis TaxID=179676 RepID=A0A336MSK8_CULSO
MATGCSTKEFETRYEKEMYYDQEYESFCANFEFANADTCWICNGYYGPNFSEPLCQVCHAFVFPSVPEAEEENIVTKFSDDEDSGNDEPEENKSDNREQSDSEGGEEEFPCIQRPDPPAPRNLSHLLELLAEEPEVKVSGEPVKDVCALPVEVLLTIFSHLDDISLCSVGQTCKQWKKILEIHTTQHMWKRYTRERWPLFQQISTIPNWLHMYSALMSSCFCRTCIIQMALKAPLPQVNNFHFRTSHLRKDLKSLHLDASEGITAMPLDEQLSHWQATILGPAGSPYEGGKFFLYIIIPANYPMSAPKVRFLTKIIHPNVSRHGDIGIDIINHNWLLSLGISKLLISVQSLLTDPFTQVCMEPELGTMYETERPKFEALARSWTWKYAMYEVLPPIDGYLSFY